MRTFLLICALLLIAYITLGNSINDSLIERVNDFCKTEFNGDAGERVKYFENSIRDSNAADFTLDAVDIVNNYKVLPTITIVGNSASVNVEYDLVAEIREVIHHGWPGGPTDSSVELALADKVIMVKDPKHVQKLSWKLNDADRKWYLISTQLPKVSRNALLKLLQVDVQRQTKTLNKNPGRPLPHLEASRKWFLKKIALLEGLPVH